MAIPRPLPPDHQLLPVCPGCRQRDARIVELERLLARRDTRIAKLEERVRTVTADTRPNATNSSIPPSANPLDAPKPVTKKPTGRKPGGQPGHPGHSRTRLPPERIQQVVPFVPKTCAHCQALLPAAAGLDDPEPTWHQVVDLPEIIATVTEYQGHARTCACCGHRTWATIPEGIRRHAQGPRLTAVTAYLAGCPHVSKRGIEEIVETIFQAPLSLGTVANLEQEMSAALQPAHAEAQQQVQQAKIKHVDETGWKEAGKKRWLWAACTVSVVCFVIHSKRGLVGLLALLAGKIKGICCSDRWPVYQVLAVTRRQLCWAHLKRDFQKLVDRGGAGKKFGDKGLATAKVLFDWWKSYRGGGISRRRLRQKLEPVRHAMRRWLEEGARCTDTKAANFCHNLLDLEPALWTFLYRPGVEPTNNLIERLLRSAVLWRKIAFGCHSDSGCRFVERILTVVQTLRLQKRPMLPFLEKSLRAHRDGQRPPKLVQRV